MKAFCLLVLCFCLFFCGCEENQPIISDALFTTTTTTTIYKGQSVKFNDLSKNPSTWSWTFDGGTPSNSSQQNPSEILYKIPGVYDVSLTISNSNGSHIKTMAGYINVLDANVQTLLDNNVTIDEIFTLYPVDSLYGKYYQGGLIFYVDSIAKDGYVAASQDQSTGLQWCGSSLSSGANGNDIGDGPANTLGIVNNCPSASYAAGLCYNLNYSGYTDWFLPSPYGVYYMYQNLHLRSMGNFTNVTYWTSRQSGIVSNAYAFDFSNGGNVLQAVSDQHRVRAIKQVNF